MSSESNQSSNAPEQEVIFDPEPSVAIGSKIVERASYLRAAQPSYLRKRDDGYEPSGGFNRLFKSLSTKEKQIALVGGNKVLLVVRSSDGEELIRRIPLTKDVRSSIFVHEHTDNLENLFDFLWEWTLPEQEEK